MRAIDIGPDGMDDYIVRFKDLQPKQARYGVEVKAAIESHTSMKFTAEQAD